MEQNKVLQLVYTFFLGLMLAIFIGVGINTFYEPPIPPEYPAELSTYTDGAMAEKNVAQNRFDKENNDYMINMKLYSRNVSAIAIAAATILLAVSILYEKKIKAISDGVMLGGLFTLLYSVGRGFASQDNKYLFIMVCSGLALVLFLGYHRFVKQSHIVAKRKSPVRKV